MYILLNFYNSLMYLYVKLSIIIIISLQKINSKFQIAFCLTSQTWVYPPTIFTQNLAWAMAYNLPNETTAFKPYFGSKYVQHRRNRRDLYGKMEQIMNS